MNSVPKINKEWTHQSLDTWNRLGPLDLNEVNDKNRIHLNNKAEYKETETDIGVDYGQHKGNDLHGIARFVGSKYDREKN